MCRARARADSLQTSSDGPRSRQQDALAEELESCAAEHLALEHLDPVDMTFHDAGVPRLGEPCDDSVKVAFEVVSEPAETGQVGRGSG